MEQPQSVKKTSCLSICVKVDFKGKYFNFYLPDGNLTYKTSGGGLSFLLLGFIWMTYALRLAI